MISSMFPWINMHVMNVYADNLFICEDDNNTPKENLPPSLTIPYPKTYPIIVSGIVRYYKNSHFNIVFFDAFHA